MTLAEVLAAAAASLPGQTGPAVATGGAMEYRRGERLFAVVELGGGAASFRLAQAVGAAALKTPDTESSERGRGWVTLRPVELDGHTLDRATAWFQSAWRAAAD